MPRSYFFTSLLGDPRGIILLYRRDAQVFISGSIFGLKYTHPGADQSPGLTPAFLGHVQQQQCHHQKPLVQTGVEGSYIPFGFLPQALPPALSAMGFVFSFSFFRFTS